MGVDFDFSMLDAMDVLDIAVFIEREARDNYEQLATWSEAKSPEAAAFFRRMAGLEALHERQVAERRAAVFGTTPARYTDSAAWEVETPDYAHVGPTFAMAQALRLALAAEERAEAYYRGVLEYVRDPQTEQFLAFLADSEVEHQRLLKGEIAKL